MTIRSSTMRRASHALLLALALTSPALAAGPTPASLFADLATGTDSTQADIFSPFTLGDKVLVPVVDYALGDELWVTDGTDAGTELLLDACPGECSGFRRLVGIAGGLAFWTGEAAAHAPGEDAPGVVVVSDGTRSGTRRLGGLDGDLTVGGWYYDNAAILGETVIFNGCTPANGCELWKSDGTEAGTSLVKELVPGAGGTTLHRLLVAGGRLFFFAEEAGGLAVYTSDGTAAGTVRIESTGAPEILNPPAAAGNRIFFVLPSATTGTQTDVWTSDGTAAGTRRLADFVPQLALVSNGSAWLEAAGDHVYFTATDGVHGAELWKSDGTAQGTVAVTNFPPNSGLYFSELSPDVVEELNGRVLFKAVQQVGFQQRWRIWVVEGRTTKVLVDDCDYCGNFTRIGSRLLFSRGGPFAGDVDLMATDGTAAGTRSLLRVCDQPCRPDDYDYSDLFSDGFLVIRTAQHLSELWRTDGTPQGTLRFADLPPGIGTTYYRVLFAGGRFYAPAYERDGWEPARKLKLMAVTAGGAWQLVAEFPAQPPSSSPHHLVTLDDVPGTGDRLLFAATATGSTPQLWTTEGAAGSARLLAEVPEPAFTDIEPGPAELTRAGDRVVFLVNEGWASGRLWTSDGTPAGTFPLAAGDDAQPHLTTSGGEAYFVRSGPGFDEVWKTDGTDAGTTHRFVLPGDHYALRHLTALGDELYFVSDYVGREVWRSSLSGAGMARVATFASYSLNPAPWFTRLGSDVFFVAAGHDQDREVWKTGGTPATTTRLVDAVPGDTGSRPADLLVSGGALYFFADTSDHERALFRSDGTTAGTAALRQFRRPVGDAPSAEPIALDGRLYFVADDGVHGRELWTSDGTAAGTRLVADVFPGLASSSPAWLTVAGGRIYFAAHDGVHGRELWTSDGTQAGTTLVHDIMPGALSSGPEELQLQGSRLYFSADDGLTGRELWMLDLAQAGGVCVPSDTVLCLGGRFRVEAVWKDFTGHAGVGHTTPLTADTGGFWFFGPENVEVVLKVLDGRGVNGHHWVFYGALSSVSYALTVTDVQTGLTVRYRNPSGQLASVADTTGFGPLGASLVREHVGDAAGSPPRRSSSLDPRAKAGACTPSSTRLCLRDGRFAVEATWKDFAGNSGVGTAVPLTGDTGWFWFFGPTNVEVILKVLDGTPINGKHWVFYGALSSVEYTLRVTDTQTGAVRTYVNPSGNLASVADVGAF